MNSMQGLIIIFGAIIALIVIGAYFLRPRKGPGTTRARDVTPKAVLEIIKVFQALDSVPKMRELRVEQKDSPKVFLDSPAEASMTYGEIVEWVGLPFGSMPYEVRDDLGDKISGLSSDGKAILVNKVASENPTSLLAVLCRELSRKVLHDCGLDAEANDEVFVDVTCAYLGFSTLLLNSRFDVCNVITSVDGASFNGLAINVKYTQESRYVPVGILSVTLLAVSHLVSVGMAHDIKKECSKLSAPAKDVVAMVRKDLKRMGLLLDRGYAMSPSEWLAANETTCGMAVSGIQTPQ